MKHCLSQDSCREGGLSMNMDMSLPGKLPITWSQNLLEGADKSRQVHLAAPYRYSRVVVILLSTLLDQWFLNSNVVRPSWQAWALSPEIVIQVVGVALMNLNFWSASSWCSAAVLRILHWNYCSKRWEKSRGDTGRETLSCQSPNSMHLFMRYSFLGGGAWHWWVNLWKVPAFFLPCHQKIVLALHSVSCSPLHNEGNRSLAFRGAEIGDWGMEREPERWEEREREAQVQGWRRSFPGSLRERCGEQLWGMREVDERRKGIALSAMAVRMPDCDLRQHIDIWEMREKTPVTLKLPFDCWKACLRVGAVLRLWSLASLGLQ